MVTIMYKTKSLTGTHYTYNYREVTLLVSIIHSSNQVTQM